MTILTQYHGVQSKTQTESLSLVQLLEFELCVSVFWAPQDPQLQLQTNYQGPFQRKIL